MIYTPRVFFRRLLNLDTISMAVGVITRQNELLMGWQRSWDQRELQHARNVRDLIEQFLIVQSDGMDVRDELIKGLRDMNDHVARLEEHAR